MTVRELADRLAHLMAGDPSIADAPVRVATHCCEESPSAANVAIRDAEEPGAYPSPHRPTAPILLLGED